MALPLKYSFRNVFVRWLRTLATVVGIGCVIGVWVWLQAMAAGLERASGRTGDPRNMLIVRRGADSESTSQITKENLSAIQYAEEIARDEHGAPLVSADTLVVVYLARTGSGGANVIFRGVSPAGPALRPQVSVVEGRWFSPGNREATVSKRLAARFADMHVGGTIKVGVRELKVVGHFDAGGSAYDSEAWLDANEARTMFNRDHFASVLARPVDAAAGARLKEKLETDKRLVVRVVPEVAYYGEQTKTAGPIQFFGNFIAIIMSLGALLSAMNTMYASVGARTREIGTLRVLGYRSPAVALTIVIEGVCVAGLGGVFGSAAVYFLSHGAKVGTFNFQTFSESVFEITVTPALVAQGMLLAVIVGAVGSLLPALRAARMPVIAALREI